MSDATPNAGLARIVDLHRVTTALIARMTDYSMPARIVVFDEMVPGVWSINEHSVSFEKVPIEAVHAMGRVNMGLGPRGDNHFYTLGKDGILR